MQRAAHSSFAGIEFFYHSLYLFTKTCLVEVKTENILASIQLLQTAPILIGLTYFQRGYDSLQFCQHGVR